MIELSFDDGGLSVRIQKAPDVMGRVLQVWIEEVIQKLQRAIVANMGSGGLIGIRSGDLRRAMLKLITITSKTEVEGMVWPDPSKVKYGAIQEHGGIVTAKNSQNLAIPIGALAQTPRISARMVINNPEAYGYDGTFVLKGPNVIMGRVRGSNSIVPLFALKRSVRIPARHYIADTIRQQWQWIAKRLEEMSGDAVLVLLGSAR